PQRGQRSNLARQFDGKLVLPDRDFPARSARKRLLDCGLNGARAELKARQRLGLELDSDFLARRIPNYGILSVGDCRESRAQNGLDEIVKLLERSLFRIKAQRQKSRVLVAHPHPG